jgi:ABC-2 type transport system permease protein
MMLVASLGRTEEAASGAGWALMMPMSMLGGGMIPLAMMPQWIQPFTYASPVRWAIISYEGAIWRGFSLAEMVLPCAILIGIGAVAFAIGARRFKATLA